MVRLSIGDMFYHELFEFATRDDCCDKLLPSDIRILANKLKEQAIEIKMWRDKNDHELRNIGEL